MRTIKAFMRKLDRMYEADLTFSNEANWSISNRLVIKLINKLDAVVDIYMVIKLQPSTII